FVVRTVHPKETVVVIVAFPKRGLSDVEFVQILDESLCAAMIRTGVEQPPVQLRVRAPLVALAELAAHEQQLLTGEKPLIREQRAEVREGLPVVARHPAAQRAFAVNDLVVRMLVNEILMMMVEHRYG